MPSSHPQTEKTELVWGVLEDPYLGVGQELIGEHPGVVSTELYRS